MEERRQQPPDLSNIGRSRARRYTVDRPDTRLSDVAGIEAAKDDLQLEIDFLREPDKFGRLGARIPKGVLLIGPPGTGKTLIARAVAGEADVPFFSVSATEFVEVFVGVGASRVRDLFERAQTDAPAIIFIDEIDAIGRRRSSGGRISGGNDEREQTLNQLLVAMDGFEPNQAVIVLAATNRPDVLDQALLRPGRFDRQVLVDLPNRQGREAILRVHTRNIPLAPTVDLAAIAASTPGMSGADLAGVANEAALNAARSGKTSVAQDDFVRALDRVMLGPEASPILDWPERRAVAYHEAGHALAALLMRNVDPVQCVTIVPRGRSLGVTQFQTRDDRRNFRRDYLLDRMAVGLGGRSAEEIACGDISSGAQIDLQEVTGLARAMVTQFGMAENLGPTYFGGDIPAIAGGMGIFERSAATPWAPRKHSEATSQRIDAAVHYLITDAHERARLALSSHRRALDAIAAALVMSETLDREELLSIAAANGVSQAESAVRDDGNEVTPGGAYPASGSRLDERWRISQH